MWNTSHAESPHKTSKYNHAHIFFGTLAQFNRTIVFSGMAYSLFYTMTWSEIIEVNKNTHIQQPPKTPAGLIYVDMTISLLLHGFCLLTSAVDRKCTPILDYINLHIYSFIAHIWLKTKYTKNRYCSCTHMSAYICMCVCIHCEDISVSMTTFLNGI